MADTVNQFKNRLVKHWANCAVLYDYHVNYNGTGSLFVAQKNCENLDVDLEAILCVHNLQYSTVQYSDTQIQPQLACAARITGTFLGYHVHRIVIYEE